MVKPAGRCSVDPVRCPGPIWGSGIRRPEVLVGAPKLLAVYLAAQRLVIWAIRLLNLGAASVATSRSLPVVTVS